MSSPWLTIQFHQHSCRHLFPEAALTAAILWRRHLVNEQFGWRHYRLARLSQSIMWHSQCEHRHHHCVLGQNNANSSNGNTCPCCAVNVSSCGDTNILLMSDAAVMPVLSWTSYKRGYTSTGAMKSIKWSTCRVNAVHMKHEGSRSAGASHPVSHLHGLVLVGLQQFKTKAERCFFS